MEPLSMLGLAAGMAGLGGGTKVSTQQSSSLASNVQFNPIISISSPESKFAPENPSEFNVAPVQRQTADQSGREHANPGLSLPAPGPVDVPGGDVAKAGFMLDSQYMVYIAVGLGLLYLFWKGKKRG